MMSIRFRSIILLFSVVLFCGCSSSSGNNAGEQNIGFQATDYYFVKNTYTAETNPSYLVMHSYSSFDSVFGVGAVMNMDRSKLVTEEKMKNAFAISIIYQGNDIHKFSVDRVVLKNGQLQVHYTSEITSPNASWRCNCHVTVLIDQCDFNSILFFENGNQVPNPLIKEF